MTVIQIPGHPTLRCVPLDDRLADLLIERTHDASDAALREMTRDLTRFADRGQLDEWRPGRDLLCLEGEEGALLGLLWFVDKPLPEREDYLDPHTLHARKPQVTCAIRTYGAARGRGFLTKAFAEHALERLLNRRRRPIGIWYETKAANRAARALGRQMGFAEVSGEDGGRVVGVRFWD